MKPGRDQGASSPSDLNNSSGIGNIDGSHEDKHQVEDIESYKPGKISKIYLHLDGLHEDIATQTDKDISTRSLGFKTLERPVTAPGRLITALMEEFQLAGGVVHRDLADGEEPIIKKEPEVIGLTAADIAMLDATDDMAEEVEIGSIDRHALKHLATDSLNILEKIPEDQVEAKMAESLFGLLGRFRNLKTSGQDGESDNEEQEGGKKKSK